MNVLVTGSSGQLANDIKKESINYSNLNLFLKDKFELNICNQNSLINFIKSNNIEAIINCAAYTLVDKAEDEYEIANEINFKAVNNLIYVVELFKIKLIHISTDYVFDGTSKLPYSENDKTNPMNVYGKTKLKGENLVINSFQDTIVIRTSWLYSSQGNNFVNKIIDLSSKKNSLDIISDQIGSPTYAADLANVCLEILSSFKFISKKGNLYHYSNEGETSWYDFAKSIVELNRINCDLNPISTKEFKSKAFRPKYSVLNKNKIKADYNLKIPHWKDSLIVCLNKIKKT